MAIEPSDHERVEALLAERIDQLASLSALSNEVLRAASLEETYAAALDCLAETLSPDRAAVLLFDADGVIRFKAWRGLSDEYRQATEGHSPWAEDDADPAPVLVERVAESPELRPLLPTIEAEGIRSLGFFPLVQRGRLLGKFMVYFDAPHAFTPAEVRLAEAIGSHVALELGRRHAEERARFLADASEALGSSLDYRIALSRLAALAAASLAEACAIHVLGERGLELLAAFPIDRRTADETSILRVIESGEPLLGDAETIIPLSARGRTLGALTLSGPTADLELTRDLARRAGLALDNGLTHEAEQRARDVAERLQLVTQTLAGVLTAEEIAEVVVREGAAALGAAAGWIAATDPNSADLRRLTSIGYQPRLDAEYAVRPLSSRGPSVDAVVEGRPRWLESRAEVVGAYPGLEEDYAAAGFEAMAVVPLPAASRPSSGVIALNFTHPKVFRDDEKELLLALAAQCGQALERATLYSELQERADAASVLAHVGDGVFQLDAEERITLWNRGAEVITGIAERDAVGRGIADVLVGWEALKPRISITDVPLAFGRREAVPATVQGRDLSLAISGVGAGDSVVYAFRDVTEAERLEQARRDFLATASHELRTPLAGVFGATKTLLQRDLDEENRRALLTVIDNESQRLAHILDEILLASRLDAGRIGLKVEACDATAVAREAIELQRVRTADGIDFALVVPDGLPAVLCDRAKLKQVLVNLLDNAIKYSPTGGTIVVSAAADTTVARLSVADRGLGIPASQQEHVFEKFYRLDPELSRGVGGTGLGLFISRELVGAMHGRIWVDSVEGEGSTFHVELPLAG